MKKRPRSTKRRGERTSHRGVESYANDPLPATLRALQERLTDPRANWSRNGGPG